MLFRYRPGQDLWSCRNSVKVTFVVEKRGRVGSFFHFPFCLRIVPCLPCHMTCIIMMMVLAKIFCTYSLFLRSNNGLRLNYSSCKSLATLGDRSFHVAAPKLWNDLPCTLRNITYVQNFKKAIKTFLFAKAF